MRKRRIVVLALCCLFALLLLSSFGIVSARGHHHCTGEDCPVCAAIQSGEQLLRSLALLALTFGGAAAMRRRASRVSVDGRARVGTRTLVSLKVKLSN